MLELIDPTTSTPCSASRAAALDAHGLAITMLHTELLHTSDTDYHFVPMHADVPAGPMASEDVAGVVTALNSIFAEPFKDRLRALVAEGDDVICYVVTDVVWFSAHAAVNELGLPTLGLLTNSAPSF
jgi:hypothetical protein